MQTGFSPSTKTWRLAISSQMVPTLKLTSPSPISQRHIITGVPPDLNRPNPGPYTVFSWGFYLHPIDAYKTRFIIRVRANYFPRSMLAPLVYLLAEPADFIYNYGTLHGIKQRVESN